jgi:hypothetical protein
MAELARFCGDDAFSVVRISALVLEKSSFLRTDAETDAGVGATIEPLTGDDTGPRDGFLLAGDCKYVLIGDLDRGGGNRILARFRAMSAAVGSGIVLSPISISSSLDKVVLAFFRAPFTF